MRLSSEYLSKRALKGLASYKYKSGGLTWLDHLHTPAWNALVARLPMWLAPNLITLIGTMFVIAAWLLSVVYMPSFQDNQCPTWLYYFNAAAVVIYVNLDCIDGKQARRTGSSSPLGQLFDHGCDALSLHLLLDSVRASLQLQHSWAAVTMELAIMFPWLLAHLEEYHTGVMLYGNGFFGILEGNYALVVIHLISAIFGPGIWSAKLPFDLPSQLEPMNCIGYFALAGVAIMAGISAAGQLYRVLIFPTATLPREEAGNKQLGNGAAFLHLMYLMLLLALGFVYLTSSSPSAFAHGTDAPTLSHVTTTLMQLPKSGSPAGMLARLQDLLYRICVAYHPRVAGATWGFVYALVSSQLIIAHMCKEPFAPYTWAMAVLALGCANSRLQVVPPPILDAGLLVISFVGYSHFVACIINQICQYLDISCLSIKKKPAPKQT